MDRGWDDSFFKSYNSLSVSLSRMSTLSESLKLATELDVTDNDVILRSTISKTDVSLKPTTA